MSTVTAGEIADLFRVLGDPTRIEILRLLSTADEVACTTLDDILPISKSTISYHIKALKTVGLLTVRKDGRWYHYTLRRDRVEALLPGFFELLQHSALPKVSVSAVRTVLGAGAAAVRTPSG